MKETSSNNNDTIENEYYFLFSDISEESAKNVCEWILQRNIARNYKELKLVINSPGGCVNSGFAIIDMIQGSSIPVHTYGLGCVASSALAIFMSGKKRFLTPKTSILSHQYWWGSFGKEHELFAVQKEYKLTTERIIQHYKKCTGLSKKQIRKKLLPPHDVWLSAKEAKQFNLCDAIRTFV